MLVLLIAASLLVVIVLLILFSSKIGHFGNIKNRFGNTMIFKAPPSFTKLSIPESKTKLSELTAANVPQQKGTL